MSNSNFPLGRFTDRLPFDPKIEEVTPRRHRQSERMEDSLLTETEKERGIQIKCVEGSLDASNFLVAEILRKRRSPGVTSSEKGASSTGSECQ